MGAVVRRADPGLLRQVTTTPRPVTMPGAPTTTPTTPTTMLEFRVSVTGQKNLRIAREFQDWIGAQTTTMPGAVTVAVDQRDRTTTYVWIGATTQDLADIVIGEAEGRGYAVGLLVER